MMRDLEIVETYAMPDYIHILVKIPSKVSASYFRGYLKGKSTLMIHDRQVT
jgi:putative transposase